MLKAAQLIRNANHITAFTGAGISVESGIPPFRGKNGLWSKYDPVFLDIKYFQRNPIESWKLITQNIDNLHQKAGSKMVYEFHGNSRNLICINCQRKYLVQNIDLSLLPPKCKNCGGVLKPDFVFFGEPIPESALTNSFVEAENADVFIIVGTTGEIIPASLIPYEAKKNNIKIIEINTKVSNYTNTITDVFIEGRATEIMQKLMEEIKT